MPLDFADASLASTHQDFLAAAERIRNDALRTPLLRWARNTGQRTLRLKAENLQPIGSFKIRCGASVIGTLGNDVLQRGLSTVSAGNFAQGLALAAQRRGVHVTAHVPDTAPAIKLNALRQSGVTLVPQTPEKWWNIASSRITGADDGVFIHPVSEPAVIHGNGTIALELLEQWPEIDTVVAPVGGGGLISGIALALRAAGKHVRIVACEPEGAAPLAAAKRAGKPVQIEKQASFIDAIGSSRVLDSMWPLLNTLVDDVIVVPIKQAQIALRMLALDHHLIVEGAGAVAFAAALSSECGGENVAVILSGGNIDPARFCEILTRS